MVLANVVPGAGIAMVLSVPGTYVEVAGYGVKVSGLQGARFLALENHVLCKCAEASRHP